MIRLSKLASICLAGFLAEGPDGIVQAAQPVPPVSAANILVVQNDTGNTTASVTASTALSINDFRIRPGSNRADYDVQIGGASTNNVADGILISCIDQNGRDNGKTSFPRMNYGTSAGWSSAGAGFFAATPSVYTEAALPQTGGRFYRACSP